MFKQILSVLGDSNEKAIKKFRPLVEEVNSLEPSFEKLSDAELRTKTDEFKKRLADGELLDDLLPEAFAAVREAAKRTLHQRHFDAQIMGGIVLHQGKIAEMKTGEGKTLVATLPVYLNALTGKGVHVVTVNDYLAKRDTQWMGPIYNLLDIKVSCLQHEAAYAFDPTVEQENPSLRNLRGVSRRDAYLADVTYGTNNEFGFDYLRDNMVMDLAQCVQRELNYAIVDEVDNILIDEARTPLIISGPTQQSTKIYETFAKLAPRLKAGEDFIIDEKQRVATLTETGIARVEGWLNVGNLYDPDNYALTHYIENALRAEVLYKKDRDYVARDGEVIIVDEFTGRLMLGRRYSDGLHQAIEAKEGLKVQGETITYATITLQNYFRLYKKLAGMTGTAATEGEEFWKIYKLEVVVIPTHRPMVRRDHSDYVFKTEEGKFRAVVREIEDLYKQGQPVLVGTVSIEKSERLSEMLKRKGVPHQVLNAKFHEKEAAIIAQAGRLKAVTVATNMAGRGTDIVLGGSPDGRSNEEWEEEHRKVVELGGLHILGTERHEARRIDNQLRGRSGRQGDPGSSRFYESLEDDLMRRFGGERIKTFMDWAGLDEDTPIENALVSKAVENAQSKVEAFNFEIRKHLVEYDDVVNKHRDVIYGERRKILGGADLKTNVQSMIREEIKGLLGTYLGGRDSQEWNLEGLEAELQTVFPLPSHLKKDALKDLSRGEIEDAIVKHADELYEKRETEMSVEVMRTLERLVMLRVIDGHWVEHLTAMENLRQGVGLEAVGQRDPLVMYKKDGHEAFQSLLGRVQNDIVHTIYHVGIVQDGKQQEGQQLQHAQAAVKAVASKPSIMAKVVGERRADLVPANSGKVGRNDPCPCGSGKKYKRCHGA